MGTPEQRTEDYTGTINTEIGPTLKALKMSVDPIFTKCPPSQSFPRLTQYIADKSLNMTLPELENGLFLLSNDLRERSQSGTVNLRAFVLMHPLLVLVSNPGSSKTSALVEKEFLRVVNSTPAVVPQYKWTVKACEFVNDLAIKWGLVTIHQFVHRLHIAPESIVLDILSILNRNTDFSKIHEVNDFLLRTGKVNPEITRDHEVSQREKRAVATRIGLHLLSLPPWWKCDCLYSEEDRLNLLLRTYLKHFLKEYLELESAVSEAHV